jgi:hypothetical protein
VLESASLIPSVIGLRGSGWIMIYSSVKNYRPI